eukprot:5411290-Prymnesium_polylepis.1
MAWWDYGYQIAGIANRTTIADGNTCAAATPRRTATPPCPRACAPRRHARSVGPVLCDRPTLRARASSTAGTTSTLRCSASRSRRRSPRATRSRATLPTTCSCGRAAAATTAASRRTWRASPRPCTPTTALRPTATALVSTATAAPPP